MGLADLLFQSAAVGAGAFFVGTVPLWFSSIASGRKLKITSTYGKGLLVGAALTIIIPEGVSTLYTSTSAHRGHSDHNLVATGQSIVSVRGLIPGSRAAVLQSVLPPSIESTPVNAPQARDDDNDNDDSQEDDDDDNDDAKEDDDDDDQSDPSRAVGLSLISGFILMLLIEQASHQHESVSPSGQRVHTAGGDSHPSHPARQSSTLPLLPEHEERPDWHRLQRRPSTLGEEGEEEVSAPVSPPSSSVRRLGWLPSGSWKDWLAQYPKSATSTFALVVHSLADGIALGASARSGDSDLGLVVFLAIMIHKIPASVGLCTTLQADGLPIPLVRWGIGAFAAAAPIGAFITYALVNLVGRLLDENALQYWTGVALTFSGGTFLYVATVIQDINSPSHAVGSDDDLADLTKAQRLGLLIGGMVTPIILATVVHGD